MSPECHLDNDFAASLRKAAAPEITYLRGFAPADLISDGSYHPLKVTVSGRPHVKLQARRGYWAPKNGAGDSTATSKKELEDDVFSRVSLALCPPPAKRTAASTN